MERVKMKLNNVSRLHERLQSLSILNSLFDKSDMSRSAIMSTITQQTLCRTLKRMNAGTGITYMGRASLEDFADEWIDRFQGDFNGNQLKEAANEVSFKYPDLETLMKPVLTEISKVRELRLKQKLDKLKEVKQRLINKDRVFTLPKMAVGQHGSLVGVANAWLSNLNTFRLNGESVLVHQLNEVVKLPFTLGNVVLQDNDSYIKDLITYQENIRHNVDHSWRKYDWLETHGCMSNHPDLASTSFRTIMKCLPLAMKCIGISEVKRSFGNIEITMPLYGEYRYEMDENVKVSLGEVDEWIEVLEKALFHIQNIETQFVSPLSDPDVSGYVLNLVEIAQKDYVHFASMTKEYVVGMMRNYRYRDEEFALQNYPMVFYYFVYSMLVGRLNNDVPFLHKHIDKYEVAISSMSSETKFAWMTYMVAAMYYGTELNAFSKAVIGYEELSFIAKCTDELIESV